MEKRTILAVVLSLIVLIGWSFFFQKQAPPQKPQPPVQEPVAGAPAISGTIQSPSLPPAALPAPEAIAAKDVVVETDLYRAVFSTEGAVIKSWELKTFKDADENTVMLLKERGIVPALGILLTGENRTLPLRLIYAASTEHLRLSKGKEQGELIFTASTGGVSIRKRFLFYNNDFRADLTIETANIPAYEIAVGTDFGVFDKQQTEHKGPVTLIDSSRKEFDEKLSQRQELTGIIRWVANEDKYFTAALVPTAPHDSAVVWKEGTSAEIAFQVKQPRQDFIFYAGPKEYDRLKQFDKGLEHIIDFGWFAFVAMPLFWALKYCYNFLGNYGWAIILITIVVRIPFIPILNKSQKSMKKLQKVQPLMNEIKEKYKKDPQRMQKEMMEIYKKHKVNPVGGCLPMLLQIPVFIALYNVLGKAIELRGAPFVLWITDLAAKDPYYVLPITMGATMVIQQKMTPSTMDPTQAKIMMFMPIIFTFMFLSFPSGLVLYWLINNILGIAQQYYINKRPD